MQGMRRQKILKKLVTSLVFSGYGRKYKVCIATLLRIEIMGRLAQLPPLWSVDVACFITLRIIQGCSTDALSNSSLQSYTVYRPFSHDIL